jgi:HD-GYP domain-containing protein (c-di-GMP phosphodiesterase class II)
MKNALSESKSPLSTPPKLHAIPVREAPTFSPRLYSVAAIIAAVVLIGLWLVTRFAAADLARDMQTWQEKLNLIAESRTTDVSTWVNQHFKSLRTLSGNPSLQLYLSEVQMPGATNASDSGQKGYLRNLILFTADQTGFGHPAASSPVKANVPSDNKNALAVIGKDGQIVVSTAISPELAALITNEAQKQSPGQEYLIDMQKDADGAPYIGFVVPIYSIQGEKNAESQIGKVVGIKTLDGNLFALLKHPGTTENTLEAILIRPHDEKLEYLSPLQDGSGALTKQIEISAHDSAEAELFKTVGEFSSDKKDYRDAKVLSTSRNVTGTPWKLIVKIDRQEALAKSAERRTGMVLFFIMITTIVALLIATIWWHAHSRRAMMMSRHFRTLAAQARAQEQLLRLVTDHQPESIYIIDNTHTYRFANQKAAAEADMEIEFVIGKTLNDVRGAASASYIKEWADKAAKSQRVLYDVMRHKDKKQEKMIHVAFVPIRHIPVASLFDPTPGVLVVEQDISEVMHERERRINIQMHLVQTLVRLVDRRDPFSANHSLLVSHLAQRIAQDMGLDPTLVETARLSGCLMNIGKILVPTELLTKTSPLNQEEKQTMQDSMQAASGLIEDINFDGPVAETLRQWQEKWDGTGPLGLKGDGILISARIIAAANAFIGMISPRSWRNAIPIESANKFLIDQSNTHFDHKVVVALMNYVENHNGRKWIEQILNEKRSAA